MGCWDRPRRMGLRRRLRRPHQPRRTHTHITIHTLVKPFYQVTLAMAVFRRFPWKKVPVYMFAQLMGALCGAAIVYANYFHAIDIYEGGRGIRTVPGTAGLFATYAVRT